MDTTQAVKLLPAKFRLRAYIALGVAALLLTAASAFFLASPWPVPWVIPAGLAGVGVLAGPFAILAGNNITPDPRRAQVDEVVLADADAPHEPDDPEGRRITFRHSA